MADLQLAKKQTWEEKERLSALYEEQRKINLANRVGTTGGVHCPLDPPHLSPPTFFVFDTHSYLLIL